MTARGKPVDGTLAGRGTGGETGLQKITAGRRLPIQHFARHEQSLGADAP